MRNAVLDLDAAGEALRAGKVIAFPTETFYGLGCDALNPDAVGAVYAMKQRPYGLPLPVIIGGLGQLERIVAHVPPIAEKLMAAFWPGSLSIIFAASPETPDLLTAGANRIAVRFSPHPACMDLCRASDLVLTASSANISGHPPVTNAGDLDPELMQGVAGIYDVRPHPGGGLPSTIVDIVGENVRVLRVGAVGVEALRAADFNVVLAD